MRKIVILVIIFLVVGMSNTRASHIAGGEFELRYSGLDELYYVYLNMYYDDLNAQAGLFDVDVTINVSIFSKATNIRQKNIQMRRVSTDEINYTTNGCDDPAILKTRKFRYVSLKSDGTQGAVNLSGLTEPQGYYISWERCCRNYQTVNIEHKNFFGNYISGQTFYLEFPPVKIGGAAFINTSPIFAPVPAQFLCLNTPIQIDFSATDFNGDSLVYKLVTPIQGHTTENSPTLSYPEPAPYDSISWAPSYSVANAIPGNPSLIINSQTGILFVKPSQNGLFAFAVACMEYRNGFKIGEVRRDFQFLVRDCPVTYSPSVGINPSNNAISNTGSTNWGNTAPDTIVVRLNKDTCYSIFVTDSSANFFNTNDYVNIYFGATNLPKSVISFTPNKVLITPSSDTARMDMCFSTCDKILVAQDSVYFLDIIVKDGEEGSCNRKTDTLRTYVYVDVDESNGKPFISTSLAPTNYLLTYPDTVTSFIVYGLDTDLNDIKSIEAKPFRFRMVDYRMNYDRIYSGADSVAYRFDWIPTCFDLNRKAEYIIDFIIKDNSCIYTHVDTVRVTLRIQDSETELKNIIPTNLITPNKDGLNDCFYIKDIPPNNCTYIFKSIQIYNRWGANVYSSSDRNFKWCPDDLSDGIYYYGIDLSEKTIKGWIQIIR